MSHSLTSNGSLCDLNSASVTDNALIADLLVLSAVTLPVLCRSEYLFAEKSVLLRLQSTVVDGLRLLYLAVRPLPYLFRRSQTDLYRIKTDGLICGFFLFFRHMFSFP